MENLLKNIITRQKAELDSVLKTDLLHRDRLVDLKRGLQSNLIKIILGPRRAGKSTLALLALRGLKFSYINFEDEGLPEQLDGDQIMTALDSVYGPSDYYLFDEIQYLQRWPQFLNRQHRLRKNLIVAGSNAKLLSVELSSSLTGRHHAIELLPLSYKEISASRQMDFNRYLREGGFPDIVIHNNDYRSYLPTLWESIILKDIAKRKKIRNVTGLTNVLNLMLASISSKYSLESIARALEGKSAEGKVSAPTIKNFLTYANEAYLLSELTRYDHKPKNRIKADRKCYTVDNGFYTSKQVSFSQNQGALLENAVFNALRGKGYQPNSSLFYYQTKSSFEVDFILREGLKNTEAIQVCLSLGSLKTEEREFRELSECAEELNINKLTVITLNQQREEDYQNKRISIVPADKWMIGG